MGDEELPLTGSGPLPDPRRPKIETRLRSLVGPGPADFYRDACDLVDSAEKWRTVTHLVHHCMREIEGAVRDVLEPMSTGSSSAPLARDGSENHKDTIRAILAALEIPEDNPVAKKWLEQAGSYQGRAHRNSLGEPVPFDEKPRRFFDDFQGILEYVLDRMESRYELVVKALDELAERSPATSADLKFLLTRAPQGFVARARFFEKASDPSWLDLLRNKQMFASPPDAELNDDNMVAFPPWPQIGYLVRMAGVKPAQVIGIAKAIPHTDNAFVNGGIVDIARALVPSEAVELLPRLVATIDGRYKIGYPSRLATMIGTFADADEMVAAETLLRAMLAFEPEPVRAPDETADDAEVAAAFARAHYAPTIRVDKHTFDTLLQRDVLRLVEEIGLPIVALVADLLDQAIDASAANAMRRSGEDYSSIWRREIAEGGEFPDRGIKSDLVTGLRTSITRRLAAHPDEMKDVLDLLGGHGWRVFRRLELDVLTEHPEAEADLAFERLTDKPLFDDAEVRAELDRLRAARFPCLSRPERLRLLEMIDQEPTHLDVRLTWMTQVYGREPTDDEVAMLAGTLRRDRLALLAEHLPEPWASEYAALVDECGPPASTAGPVQTGGFYRERSPMTEEELGELSVDDLMGYIEGFEADDDPLGSSPTGLAETLGNLITADPDQYLAAGRRFGELDASYAHGVLTGVIGAMDRGTEINWEGAIDLCEAIVEHPRAVNEDGSSDHAWAWARLDVTRFLVRGFHTANPPPAPLRQRIFAVIARMADDPYPTAIDEERFGPPQGTFDSLALNAVRPRAIECAVELGIWVYKQDPTDGFADVLGLVEEHLDPSADPSRAVRTTIGTQFNNFVAFDHVWASGRASSVFLSDEGDRELWEAAWDGYVQGQLRYRQTFAILREQYQLAVARMSPGSESVAAQGRDRTLGVHLMTAYWAGWIGLDDELIVDFFGDADEETRHYVIESVGRGLLAGDDPLDEDVVERLLALLDARIEAERVAPSRELSAFGLWFASSRLPFEAGLQRLRSVLAIVGSIEPPHMVVERLAATAADAPRDAAELLAEIIDREPDGWRLGLWDESAAVIIRLASASADPVAASAAHEAASRAAARGHLGWLNVAQSDARAR